jgi:hypothetical protein
VPRQVRPYLPCPFALPLAPCAPTPCRGNHLVVACCAAALTAYAQAPKPQTRTRRRVP